jgi:hypothetical protein
VSIKARNQSIDGALLLWGELNREAVKRTREPASSNPLQKQRDVKLNNIRETASSGLGSSRGIPDRKG